MAQELVKATMPSRAQLCIHTEACLPTASGRLAWVVQALRPERRQVHHPAGVRVEDLQGREYFAAENARTFIDVSLPAGTYHVIVHQGAIRRRYTVALTEGARVDLHLQQRPPQTLS